MGNTLKEAIAKEEGEAQLANSAEKSENRDLRTEDGAAGKAGSAKMEEGDKKRYGVCRLGPTKISEG